MKLTFRAGRRLGGAVLGGTVLGGTVLGGTALACAAGLLPGTAQASVVTPAKAAAASAFPRCRAHQTLTWLGLGLGGGTAGTIFYPLEFTNISNRPCTLRGYPRVSALSKNGVQIGRSSRHLPAPHRVLTLPPGSTVHASLGIIEAGNVCSRPAPATTLKVHAPGQGLATQLPFPFQACWHKRVLVVGPVQPGVGIP